MIEDADGVIEDLQKIRKLFEGRSSYETLVILIQAMGFHPSRSAPMFIALARELDDGGPKQSTTALIDLAIASLNEARKAPQ